jgi:hypothetical protein
MKKTRIVIGIMMALVMPLVFLSCDKDETEPVPIPDIQVSQTEFDVDYKAGEIPIDFTSNVIFYANVDPASQNWLSAVFSDTCQSLKLVYAESDTVNARTGTVTLSKGDSAVVITVNQAGNPNAGSGLRRVDVEYTIQTGGGYTILRAVDTEAAKIPVGSTLVYECSSDVGSIRMMNPTTYAVLAEGAPINGKIQIVWTKDMAAAGSIMTMLIGGCPVTDLYGLYGRKGIEYTIQTGGGYTFVLTTIEEAAKIPLGATVTFECSSDVGSIRMMNPTTYAVLAQGSPVNGQFSVVWSQDMVAAGSIMAMLIDGCPVTGMHYIYVRTDIEYTIQTGGGYTILRAEATEAAKIPLGSTLVYVCSSDVGSIRMMNPTTYAVLAEGAPVNGIIQIVWNKDMAAAGGIMAMLIGGCPVTDLYSHN